MLCSQRLKKNNWNWTPITLLLAIAVLCIAIAAHVVTKSHANKHSLADTVRNCPSDNIGLILYNDITGRKVVVCEYEDDQWGRLVTEVIDGVEEEVTAFAHSSRAARNELGAVVRNLTRQGYTRIEFVRGDLVEWLAQLLAQ